ncbi:hypothetical protein D9613_004245 [Agrocybe pediades]|uniref:DUF6534 domain-containing protein n=1 Tax=Agrocybe pediades TaxID=84607 RepID=A0A8H4QIX5_9AGAR|nr:hypothetical protein D9613_004245 [Agrocybe pediades]
MGAYDKTVGVLLVGIIFNTYLYGLVTYQFLVYKNTKFNDPMWIKSVVGALFVVDTIHSTVHIPLVYGDVTTLTLIFFQGSVRSLGNMRDKLCKPVEFSFWTIPFTAVATSLAAVFTQFFLGHRVYKLMRNRVLTGVIAFFSCSGFAFGVYSGVRSGIIKEVAHFAPLTPFVICWLGSQTIADLIITAALTYALSRSRTGLRRTDSIINRLIRGAIQTGLFAALFALGDLFSFVFHRDTNLYAMFAYPIGRIYTNTLLDTLNARAELRRLSTADISELEHELTDKRKTREESHTLGVMDSGRSGHVAVGHVKFWREENLTVGSLR